MRAALVLCFERSGWIAEASAGDVRAGNIKTSGVGGRWRLDCGCVRPSGPAGDL